MLTKENAKEQNGEDAGDVEIKGKKHRSCMQEPHRKAGNVAAEEAPLQMLDEKQRQEIRRLKEVRRWIHQRTWKKSPDMKPLLTAEGIT